MELEIESKKLNNYEILDRFVNELITVHQSIFKLWRHSKLATGLGIGVLVSNMGLKNNEDFNNQDFLTLSGLEKIESFIKANPI